VEAVHTAIARRPFQVIAPAPVARVPAAGVRVVHDAITRGVYAIVRGVNALLGAAVDVALAARGPRPALRPSRRRDLAVAALNGAIGDRLVESALGVRMEFRHRGRRLSLDPASLARAFPERTPKLAVFVHGLMANEHVWRFYSRAHYGNPHTTYGSRLHADLGHAPLYLRYNSGLHVSENGRRLATLLEQLVAAWPAEAAEIVLVGHSMGGLVARSACHYAEQQGLGWVRAVRHVVCLGTPHLGVPLEKLAHLTGALLGVFAVPRPFGEVVNGRSAGIKDLRFGYLLDEEWRGRDPDALLDDGRRHVSPLACARHYVVAATVTRDPSHPLARILGDTLVRVPSASGGTRMPVPTGHGTHLGARTHLGLVNDPEVYEQLRRWLG